MKKNLRKLLGVALVASPFVTITIGAAVVGSWGLSLFIFGTAAVCAAAVTVGLNLLERAIDKANEQES